MWKTARETHANTHKHRPTPQYRAVFSDLLCIQTQRERKKNKKTKENKITKFKNNKTDISSAECTYVHNSCVIFIDRAKEKEQIARNCWAWFFLFVFVVGENLIATFART